MNVYLYQAALLCEDCAMPIRTKYVEEHDTMLDKLRGEPEDSDAYPQGPYPQGGGEADTPQHCDHCNVFLENPLTGDGYAYVAEAIRDRGALFLAEWADFYKGENDELDRAIEESGLDDNPFDPESPEGRAWERGDRSSIG